MTWKEMKPERKGTKDYDSKNDSIIRSINTVLP